MQGGVGLLGNGGGSNGNESGVSEVVESDDELELGLGLSLGGGGGGAGGGGGGKGKGVSACGRILTARDFPSVVKRANASSSPVAVPASVSGTKRAADSVPHEAGSSPPGANQVVGWPPIRAYRMNSLVSQAKVPRSEEEKVVNEKEKSKDASKKKICNGNKTNNNFNEKGHLGFVKVNMDGVPIGRKVDLNAHTSYETLAQTLEEMFFASSPTINSIGGTKLSTLLDGSSEFVLTYEDKEGDWMLVGDVPWRMFLSSVKRLRIMRSSEANGIAPNRSDRQRVKPV